ncbi:MAG: transglycosylase SLT domain-containing protein [Acidobacteriota bacterium]|nr:MAG: transglycosylase SLT domain-containing protein [Acidobacteriota bacterium]
MKSFPRLPHLRVTRLLVDHPHRLLIWFAVLLIAILPVRPASSAQSRLGVESQLSKAVAAKSEAALQQVENSNPGTIEAGLARLMRGYLRLQARDHAVAAGILADPSIGRLTALGDYALYYRGQALMESGQKEGAEREFRKMAAAYPTSLLARNAILQAAGTAFERGDHQRAVDDLAPLVEKNDGTALKLRAEALEKSGRRNEAVLTLRKLYFDAPQSPEAEKVADQLTALGGSTAPANADQLRRRADKLYDAGLWVLAVQAYDQITAQFPDQADFEVRLNMGIAYYRANVFKQAVESLSRVNARTPAGISDALYFSAMASLSMSDEANAAARLAELKQRVPSSDRIPELIFNTGRYHEKRNRDSQAATWYTQLVRQYPRGPQAAEAHYWLAWRAHEAKDYRTAARMLVEHLADYSDETDNRGKAAFWGAIDTERAGDRARALTLYRALLRRYGVGWYGINAERRITALSNQGIQPASIQTDPVLRRAVAGLQDIKLPIETLRSSDRERVTRAEQMMRIAFHQSAMNELEAARANAPASPLVNLRIAQIHRVNGDNVAALNVLKRAYPDYGQSMPEEMNRESWDIFYPLKWWNVIREEGRRHSVDPYLIAGIIRQETIFDPQARSRANALGLMQLLPSTGRAVAKRSSIGGISSADLYNPVLNIQLGTAYVKQLMDRFGRFEYVAAAYNGGPTRVSRWINQLPNNEIEEWVESIPISETRLYVQGVYRNAGHYQRLYDDQGKFRSYVPGD